MTKWLLAVALILMAFPSGGMAQSKESLFGTWKLVSITDTTDKGEAKHAWGENPTGFLTYTADGRVWVIVVSTEGKPLPLWLPIPISNGLFAVARAPFIAYEGSYNFAGDKVTHHIEASPFQMLVNTNEVRSVTVQGDRLSLRQGPHADYRVPALIAYSEYVWERLKPETAGK